ncbi:hypothetical protein [Candidatus Xianfuyuplasma coldseepsis]|uniref:Uncharacterized protein n=1 Tax=Candidatus Xianfuyuplasma coldseepsis TaxID=2782163 RepID=A0A7L7KTC4_9MOLU|nr:hypothetical protein [Xianfuyuplasma coldseepsis]QMS85486.1 hypothetical protein G4Z02_06940 [Xianfuyuplasma coldseepsis]
MTFFRQALKFLTNRYNIILTILLVAIFVTIRFFIQPILVDTNATWIFSSSMQTLAALIALLPISYGYYINNLDNEKSDDYDSYIVERLKRDVYYEMMTVIIYSLVVIIVNLLSLFNETNSYFSLIIALLTVEGIGLIALYIYRLFDPNKVREILKEFDTTSTMDPNQQTVSLDTFITEYLELESTVKDFISNENDNEMVDTLPLYDIVDNLSKDFPELQEHYDTFKEIIFHRNNVIHNYTETIVDYNKYAKILELKDVYEKLNNQFVQKKIFSNVISIRKNVEKCLHEYLMDAENADVEIGTVPDDYREDIVSLLHSYFISDYYFSNSLEDAHDVDFEVIQNNYSERKLLGLDIKSLQPKNLKSIATAYFKRLNQRYMYLFLINFDSKKHQFIIMYKTKDHELRSLVVK